MAIPSPSSGPSSNELCASRCGGGGGGVQFLSVAEKALQLMRITCLRIAKNLYGLTFSEEEIRNQCIDDEHDSPIWFGSNPPMGQSWIQRINAVTLYYRQWWNRRSHLREASEEAILLGFKSFEEIMDDREEYTTSMRREMQYALIQWKEQVCHGCRLRYTIFVVNSG
jgi:hypothetical protein